MSGHHDQIGSVALCLIDDDFGRITLAQNAPSIEMIQSSTEKIVQGFLCFLPPLCIQNSSFGREVIDSGNDME